MHDPPPDYESGAPLSELAGLGEGCRNAIRFRPGPRSARHPIWPAESESNTRVQPAEGQRRIPSASRFGTREWSRATAIQIRSLVPEFPRATGIVGCSPRCRTEPFPLIWQVSPAYKTGPHAGADYIRSRRRGSSREQGAGTAVADRNRTRLLLEWMWRVDSHHHQQAYETCAPLFVLRHRRYKAP